MCAQVVVDASDSEMQFELEGFTDDGAAAAEAAALQDSSGRNQVQPGTKPAAAAACLRCLPANRQCWWLMSRVGA